MSEEKPKPLFPSDIPKITLPVLSIEEPVDRVTPTPVPVVMPISTIKGGTSYVAQLVRSLPIKMVYQILISEEKIRASEMSIALDYSTLVEFLRSSELSLSMEVEYIAYSLFGMKYDGYSIGDKLAMHGIKYDGYSKGDRLAMYGLKYDGYSKSSVAY